MIVAEDTIRKAIDALNTQRNASFRECDNCPGLFHGELVSCSESVEISIDCRKGFPAKFPTFKIIEPKRFYPHVDENGVICLFDDSSLIMRTDLPERMLIDAFDRATDILSIPLNSVEYKTEVAREFNAYWVQSAKQSIYTNLPIYSKNEFKELKCLCVDGKRIVSESIKESEFLLHNYYGKETANSTDITCMIIRLRSFNVPPIQQEYSWKQVRSFIIKNITASQKRQFQKFLNKKVKTLNRYIVIVVPSEQRDFYIGFRLYYNSRHYCKIEKLTECKVEPIMTMPIDYSYLLRRGGGGSIDFQDKSVLLIGCGSIGGFIAEDLCKCGITTLDILDKDNLNVDNVHRHILGFSDALKNHNKADLMREYLENQFPHVGIDSLDYKNRTAEAFLKKPERLKNYDLIISATGEPMLNLAINKLLYENKINTPLLVCFNEPYGIGGHVIAANLEGGCLQCLYTDIISDDITSFRGSFVATDQDFKKSISGCAGSFVEYSVLDSQQTAIMTVHLALQILKKECKKSRVVSWVGSDNELIECGYQVSDYYKQITDKQGGTISRDIPINQRCSICKKRTETSS